MGGLSPERKAGNGLAPGTIVSFSFPTFSYLIRFEPMRNRRTGNTRPTATMNEANMEAIPIPPSPHHAANSEKTEPTQQITDGNSLPPTKLRKLHLWCPGTCLGAGRGKISPPNHPHTHATDVVTSGFAVLSVIIRWVLMPLGSSWCCKVGSTIMKHKQTSSLWSSPKCPKLANGNHN